MRTVIARLSALGAELDDERTMQLIAAQGAIAEARRAETRDKRVKAPASGSPRHEAESFHLRTEVRPRTTGAIAARSTQAWGVTAAPTTRDEQGLPSPAPHAFMLAMASYAETGKSPRTLTEREQKLLRKFWPDPW